MRKGDLTPRQLVDPVIAAAEGSKGSTGNRGTRDSSLEVQEAQGNRCTRGSSVEVTPLVQGVGADRCPTTPQLPRHLSGAGMGAVWRYGGEGGEGTLREGGSFRCMTTSLALAVTLSS